MGHFLLSATEGEVILYDWSDEEWDWTWITCADLSKCSFNLYEVFTVTFYQSATHKIEQLVIIFARRMDDRKPTYTVMLCWLTEVFRTADSTENVTGTKNSSQLQLLDFQNKLVCQCFALHYIAALILRTCKYYFPSCTTLCAYHIISSEIQLSKGQVSNQAPLCCSLLQNASTRLPILA